MATATIATLACPNPVPTPLPAGVSFGHWNFDFTDAAGTKAPTQTGDGVTVTSAQFSVAASAPGKEQQNPAHFMLTLAPRGAG